MDTLARAVLISQLILATGIAVCALAHFLGKRSWTTVSAFAAGFIWAALVVLRYPVQTYPIDILERHLVTFLEALKYFSIGKAFSPIDSSLITDSVSQFYFMEITLSVAAPLCSAVLVLTLLQRVGRIRRILMPWRPVYYFSELNEKSFALAKNIHGIKRQGIDWFRSPILIFCKVDSRDTGDALRFRNEARKLDAVFYEGSIDTIPKSDPWFREVKVFLIDMDEDANVSNLLKLKPWISGNGQLDQNPRRTDSDLLVFSTDPAAELLYDNLLKELRDERIRFLVRQVTEEDIKAVPDDIQKEIKQRESNDQAIRNALIRAAACQLYDKEEARLNLHLINETHLVTQKLLLEHPLFEAVPAGGTPHISVLVVGCGYLGTQFLKNAMLCGMMERYTFQIQVIDQHAKQLDAQFFHDHPFLKRPGRVFKTNTRAAPVFHEAPVCTEAFDRVLEENCSQCNYIVVATGDDQLNILTAQHLRRWYARQALEQDTPVYPFIFAAVRNSERFATLKPLETNQFHLFANNMELFSVDGLIDRKLDAAAAMFNSCYDKSHYLKEPLLLWNQDIRQESKRHLLRKPLMIQRSNQSVALHSLYKLHDLAGSEKDFRTYAAMIDDQDSNTLCDLEHQRWTLFHALNGWDVYDHDIIFATLEKNPKLLKQGKKVHKDEFIRLHGCMISTEELPAFESKLYNAGVRPRPDFLGNDRAMCVASLFAWLILKADPDTAQQIRNELLMGVDNKTSQISIPELLKLIKKQIPLQTPAEPSK